MKVLSAYAKSSILTVELDKPGSKVGQRVELEFEKQSITGTVIRKLGNRLKIRIIKIYNK